MLPAVHLLVSIALTSPPWQASADPSAPNADTCQALVGTYVTAVTDIEGVFASRGLFTFTPDGVFLMSDSGQSGLPGIYEPFTSAQGAWKCQGVEGGQVKAIALGLNFALPSAGHSAGFGRTRYQLILDANSGQLSGTAELSFTSQGDLESADPVAKPGPVLETFAIEGKRVTLE
jgi:hypothetical protein